MKHVTSKKPQNKAGSYDDTPIPAPQKKERIVLPSGNESVRCLEHQSKAMERRNAPVPMIPNPHPVSNFTNFVGIVVTQGADGEVKVTDVFGYPLIECARDTLVDAVLTAKANQMKVLDAPLWSLDDDGNAYSDYNAKDEELADGDEEAALTDLKISDKGLDTLRTAQAILKDQPDNWRP